MKNNIITTLAVGFARHTNDHLAQLLKEKLSKEERAAIRRVLRFRGVLTTIPSSFNNRHED